MKITCNFKPTLTMQLKLKRNVGENEHSRWELLSLVGM